MDAVVHIFALPSLGLECNARRRRFVDRLIQYADSDPPKPYRLEQFCRGDLKRFDKSTLMAAYWPMYSRNTEAER